MPQRTFWASQHELRVAYEFALNPLSPGSPPKMFVRVYDQEGAIVRAQNYDLPPALAEDAFLDSLNDHFRTWMLTDAELAQRAVRRSIRTWWQVAEEQAQTR